MLAPGGVGMRLLGARGKCVLAGEAPQGTLGVLDLVQASGLANPAQLRIVL